MRTPDLYTKIVLTVIAAFLGVLCVEQSHWGRVQSVQAAEPQQVIIRGFVANNTLYDLGGDHGIPVLIVK